MATLNKTARKVLKGINDLTSRSDTQTNVLDLTVYFNNKVHSLDETINFLATKGYITISNDDIVLQISPTYEGKHYEEFLRNEIKSFLLKSALVPIIISIATTLITNLLTK